MEERCAFRVGGRSPAASPVPGERGAPNAFAYRFAWRSVCCPVMLCRGMRACSTCTLIHNSFLLNLQAFHRGFIPFGTVSPEHLLRFSDKVEATHGELICCSPYCCWSAVVKCSMASRLEIQLAAKMLYWKHKAVLQPWAGIHVVYRAQPAHVAAELGSFIFAVFPCDEKKASATAEAFDKRKGSCIISTDVNIFT